MRKITEAAIAAFLESKEYRGRNTVVKDGCLILHKHCIARWVDDGVVISLCGWNTATTRDRLKALLLNLPWHPLLTLYNKGRVCRIATIGQNFHTKCLATIDGEIIMRDTEEYLIKRNVDGIEAITLWRA